MIATPCNWPELSFGDIFDISSSKRVLERQWQQHGVPFYRAREIVRLARDGYVDNELFISESLYEELAKRFGAPEPGDLMVSAVGTLGACYQVKPTDRFYFKDASVLRFHPKMEVCSKFFEHAFLHHAIRSQVESGSGSTVGTLTISRANALRINLPPVDEQRWIAAVLDQADDLRRKRREALKLTGPQLLTTNFLEMFGNPLKNGASYPLRELNTLGRVVTGSTPPSSKDGMFGGPIPFITPGDLESDEPAARSLTHDGARASRMVAAGSALVCCIGATIGKMAIAAHECAFNQQINAVEWGQEIEPHYGINALRFYRRRIADDGASTTLPILKKSLFEKIAIPAPPLALQRSFAARVAEIDKLKSDNRAHLARLDTLFASLQNRAFRGEL